MTLDEAFALGVERAGRGDIEGALAVFRQVEAAFPGNPDVPRLTAQTYLRAGRYREGAEAMAEAARRRPDLEVVFGLIWALIQLQAYSDVDRAYRYFHGLAGDDGRCLALEGLALIQLGRYAEAVEILGRAVESLPGEQAIRRNLAIALVMTGRREEAVASFAMLLPPWDGAAAETVTVERLDRIADDYDNNTVHQYFGDRLLRLHQDLFAGRRPGRVLELGTGTGLLGSKLSASADSLCGVELSPAMLAQARARRVYDPLVEGRLPDVLDRLDGPYDTVVSACVLYYFADLGPFFRHAARLMAPGGAFLFSVDPMRDECDVGVTAAGEYAHSRPYLRRLADAAELREAAIEIDAHRRTPGFWCAFRKD